MMHCEHVLVHLPYAHLSKWMKVYDISREIGVWLMRDDGPEFSTTTQCRC